MKYIEYPYVKYRITNMHKYCEGFENIVDVLNLLFTEMHSDMLSI